MPDSLVLFKFCLPSTYSKNRQMHFLECLKADHKLELSKPPPPGLMNIQVEAFSVGIKASLDPLGSLQCHL